MEMVYEPQVKNLETKISYGTLGIINTLALHFNDNFNEKKNILLVNGDTIIRNSCHLSNTVKQNLDAISEDFKYLRMYYEMYMQGQAAVIVYFHPLINSCIPDYAQRKETDTRKLIRDMSMAIAKADGLEANTPKTISKDDNLTVYGILCSGAFAYKYLTRIIPSLKLNRRKIWMVSHCPVDFLLLETFNDIEIISSHTGTIVRKNDLPTKVFKDQNIPFNRTTYKLFGDKEFVKPLCRNRPKALELLGNNKLKLKTEYEIKVFAASKLGIDKKQLDWTM